MYFFKDYFEPSTWLYCSRKRTFDNKFSLLTHASHAGHASHENLESKPNQESQESYVETRPLILVLNVLVASLQWNFIFGCACIPILTCAWPPGPVSFK